MKIIIAPFAEGFKVTPKGIARDKFNFNWNLAFPIIAFLIPTSISFSLSLFQLLESDINLGLWWSGYNLLSLSVALLTLLDIPQPSFYEWFDHSQPINIISGNNTYQAKTQKLSQEGAEISLDRSIELSTEVEIEIITEGLILKGSITRTCIQDGSYSAIVKFQNLTLEQHRQLVQMLYCRPGQWQRKKCPGELQSFLILLKLLLRPLIFLNPKKIQQLKMQY